MPAHFANDELYRCVYRRSQRPYDEPDEPDMEYLNEHYAGKLAYIVMEQYVALVQPLSALMCYYDQRIKEIYVAHTWPRDVETADPASAYYDDPPSGCD